MQFIKLLLLFIFLGIGFFGIFNYTKGHQSNVVKANYQNPAPYPTNVAKLCELDKYCMAVINEDSIAPEMLKSYDNHKYDETKEKSNALILKYNELLKKDNSEEENKKLENNLNTLNALKQDNSDKLLRINKIIEVFNNNIIFENKDFYVIFSEMSIIIFGKGYSVIAEKYKANINEFIESLTKLKDEFHKLYNTIAINFKI